jgi:hypothetical protein
VSRWVSRPPRRRQRQPRDNGHWLIDWGRNDAATVSVDRLISISEVDPATGTSVFEMNLSKGRHVSASYRTYRVPESAIEIPLNLP